MPRARPATTGRAVNHLLGVATGKGQGQSLADAAAGQAAVWVFCLAAAGCAGNEPKATSSGAAVTTSSTGSGGSSGATSATGAAGASLTANSAGTSGGSSSTGGSAFGAPETRFTLPVPAVGDGELPALYHPDLVAEFPDVDFDTLDRLYLPHGRYRSILLGGLPQRSSERPLVITNQGGQVRVGGDAANYVFVIQGGTNWVLTGRHDAQAETGAPEYPGHANGEFAHSQGSYGILIDDAFSKQGLSGLAIGGGASDFEIEFLEVTRAEFAGIIAKTDDDGGATMYNVKLHDVYVHDVGSEGIYFGSTQAQPQHSFENLQIYANRLLRTGTEALQVGQLGSGTQIHHNVLGPAAIRWRSAFQTYQDGNVQYGQRYGSSSFHHNIVIGTGDLFVEFFPTPVDGDTHGASDEVSFTDNYFSDTSASGVYTHADHTGVSVRFERNLFRGFYFDYQSVYPDANEPVQVFGVGANTLNPHILRDNVADGPYPFIQWLFDSVTSENNLNAAIEPIIFRDFLGAELDANVRKLEWWTDRATLSPGQPLVVYPVGAVVMHGGTPYRALVENQATAPDTSPETWQAMPEFADDVRLAPDSPHAGLGLVWP